MRIIVNIVLFIVLPFILSAQEQEHCANHIILTLTSVNFANGCDWSDQGSGLDPTISINDLNGNNLIFMEVNNLTQINGPINDVILSATSNPNNCGDDYSATLGIYPIDQILFEFSIEIFENDGTDCNGYQAGNDDDYGTAIVPINILTQFEGTFDVGSCISFNYTMDISPIYEYGRMEMVETVCPDFSIIVNNIQYDQENPMGRDTIWGGSANGCDSFINIDLDFYEFVEPEIFGDVNICFEGTGVLAVDDIYAAYNWSTGETTSEIIIDLPGIYNVEVITAEGCLLQDIIVVDYHDSFFPTILGPTEFCQGGEASLTIIDDFVSYDWSTGATGSEIIITESGEYSVTVVNNEGCVTENSIEVDVVNIDVPDIVGETVFCYDEFTQLSVAGSYDKYLWSTGAVSSSIQASETGIYSVTVSNDLGCENENTIVVTERELYVEIDTFYTCFPELVGQTSGSITSPEGCVGRLLETTVLYAPIPRYEIIQNPIIISGTSIELFINLDTTQNTVVNWYGPEGELLCIDCPTVVVAPNSSGTYEVEIDYHAECQIRETVDLIVKSDTKIFFPNVFTPNSQDGNNMFKIFGADILSIDVFNVYDRWGSLLYEGSGLDAEWDGTKEGLEILNGVYVYYIEVTYNDGTSKTFAGDITLLH